MSKIIVKNTSSVEGFPSIKIIIPVDHRDNYISYYPSAEECRELAKQLINVADIFDKECEAELSVIKK